MEFKYRKQPVRLIVDNVLGTPAYLRVRFAAINTTETTMLKTSVLAEIGAEDLFVLLARAGKLVAGQANIEIVENQEV